MDSTTLWTSLELETVKRSVVRPALSQAASAISIWSCELDSAVQ